MEFRKAGARRREAGLKDFSVEKYFWLLLLSRRDLRAQVGIQSFLKFNG